MQLFRERLLEKVHATIPKGIVGGLSLRCSPKKFERKAWEATEQIFASANEKQQK